MKVVVVDVVDGQERVTSTRHRGLTPAEASAKVRQLNGMLKHQRIDPALKYFRLEMENHDVPDLQETQPAPDSQAVVYDGLGMVLRRMPLAEAQELCGGDNDFTYERLD